jgi:ribosomal protein S18 acetylase RimI-like enzyme
MEMQIRHLERDKFDAAARLFADAFRDDPGWVAVGPDSPKRRHANLRRYHRNALDVIERYGGPIYGAFEGGDAEAAEGGRGEGAAGVDGPAHLLGVAATFAAGLYPPPAWTVLKFVPGFLPAGPAAIVRGLRFSAIQEKGHPHEEHVYLWFLAVDPRHQRGGVGGALLARVYEDAQSADTPAPVYLDTANPANVPYYASHGYEELGRADGPRGASMWFMRRPL